MGLGNTPFFLIDRLKPTLDSRFDPAPELFKFGLSRLVDWSSNFGYKNPVEFDLFVAVLPKTGLGM